MKLQNVLMLPNIVQAIDRPTIGMMALDKQLGAQHPLTLSVDDSDVSSDLSEDETSDSDDRTVVLRPKSSQGKSSTSTDVNQRKRQWLTRASGSVGSCMPDDEDHKDKDREQYPSKRPKVLANCSETYAPFDTTVGVVTAQNFGTSDFAAAHEPETMLAVAKLIGFRTDIERAGCSTEAANNCGQLPRPLPGVAYVRQSLLRLPSQLQDQ
eukprot:SAG31_NODE_2749_length_5147_cov_1.972662_8_plen_210_part_00